ncbi:gamma carbonic anhydrase family protein [Pseudanabaena sp. FACHB-1277]|uniref:Gamma carbonic anhydrase family protein n=2 Tax=Pseudanabaena TaxID=1152 RepID=A0A926UW90_9CYAN|nr:gamma carbonic anhydrase family protein [Pseudanabaena cinerea FACHB-1277]
MFNPMLPTPNISLAAFIAPDAVIVGDVHLAEQVNVWYKAVIRADVNRMEIGLCTNIQDGAILHGDPNQPLVIGEYVTIGHRAIVHCAEIGRGCLIGMGAILMEGVKIGAGSIVGAGAVVTKDVPAGVVTTGVPARVLRELSLEQQQEAIAHAQNYYQLSLLHLNT